MPRASSLVLSLAVALSATTVLAGCSTDTGDTTSTVPASSQLTASPAADPGTAGAPFDPSILQSIQACLTAAGIEFTVPSLPAGATPGANPSLPPGGPGQGLPDLVNDPVVTEALAACGLKLPSGLPGSAPTG